MCSSDEWSAAQRFGECRPPSLATDGFVHLSTPAQVQLPANRLFAGRRDIVVLRVDPDLLDAEIKWEPGVPSDPASMLFPHLYGPLPVAAVIDVVDYLPGDDGVFAPM
ncbi:DUF952 domain-containing protein [Antrihabitans cavernicola]|uniref:DUF952 domain-containing protein n=1 Tax=Antrihabitans cavernicola TaxID=2495913 RepID=A0A5A7SC37_9NOCA|nr:DUF952 domain-containing protein [Spelaeibacter cavernicola]KAA0023688.1 DUF952 domain-containing protein [Spelaeibacter cavernicola]